MKQIIENEEKSLNDLINSLYSPAFLYRLLSLIYKCVSVELDQICLVLGTPKYIGILFSLLKSAPPHHKVLIL